MTTPWDRINETFRSYLREAGISANEFNEAPITERSLLKDRSDARQQLQQPDWFQVSGSISRPKTHAGARFNLFKFGAGGIYPQGLDANSAFLSLPLENDNDRSRLSFSVVFDSRKSAVEFIDNVATYVQQSRDTLYFCDGQGRKTPVPVAQKITVFSIDGSSSILRSHYAPRDSELLAAPEQVESPLIDVTFETRSFNSGDTEDVTVLSTSTDIFVYQKIENASGLLNMCEILISR